MFPWRQAVFSLRPEWDSSVWEENGFIFWQFPGKREKGEIAWSLTAFDCVSLRQGEGERKIHVEELVPCFYVPGVANPPEQHLLTLNSGSSLHWELRKSLSPVL